MWLFKRKHDPSPEPFDLSSQEPAVRKSICTGEMTVGYVDRATGKFHDMQFVPDRGAMEAFFRERGADPSQVKEIY